MLCVAARDSIDAERQRQLAVRVETKNQVPADVGYPEIVPRIDMHAVHPRAHIHGDGLGMIEHVVAETFAHDRGADFAIECAVRV